MVFLTGANGLIGSFIARKLVNENIPVRALKRKNSNLDLVADIANKIEWIEGDILDMSLLEEYIKGVDTVIHSAAIISFSKKFQNEMFETNVSGTVNIVNASLSQGIRKFIFLSSVAALGRKKNHPVITEESVWEESDTNSNYAKTKYLAELEVWRGIEEGLNAVVINPSVVLGPGDWNKGSSKIFKYVWDENLFYSKGQMNFIDVRDVTEIVFRLLKSDIQGERYILNAGTISYEELFEKIADCFKKRKPPFKAGKFLTEIALVLEETKRIALNKDPLITREIVRNTLSNYSYKNDKIRKLLDYKFRPVDETVKWICDAMKIKNVNK